MTQTSESFASELNKFAPETPIAEAWTPPSSWYIDPEFLKRERTAVFEKNWQYACPLERVRKAGDCVRVDVLDESFVVLRDSSNTLRAFHNVCRHHAAQVLASDGCRDELVCPYHGWVYSLSGELKRAPQMGAMRDFDRETFGLKPVHVEAWGPFVFLHMGLPQRTLSEELAVLDQRLAAFGMDDLRLVSRRRYPMDCNWKVFVDNYLDGGYHIAHLHHGLASQLDLDDYRTEVFDTYSIQDCPGHDEAKDAHGNDFRERIGKGAIYAWIHPNFMLNRYGPILDTNWVVPVDQDRCEVVFDYWFPRSMPDSESFIELSLAASDRVQQEDVWISEAVQRGLRSRSYESGRYAPAREGAMHHFHRLLYADLKQSLQQAR